MKRKKIDVAAEMYVKQLEVKKIAIRLALQPVLYEFKEVEHEEALLNVLLDLINEIKIKRTDRFLDNINEGRENSLDEVLGDLDIFSDNVYKEMRDGFMEKRGGSDE